MSQGPNLTPLPGWLDSNANADNTREMMRARVTELEAERDRYREALRWINVEADMRTVSPYAVLGRIKQACEDAFAVVSDKEKFSTCTFTIDTNLPTPTVEDELHDLNKSLYHLNENLLNWFLWQIALLFFILIALILR